jgi:hypothetical protein
MRGGVREGRRFGLQRLASVTKRRRASAELFVPLFPRGLVHDDRQREQGNRLFWSAWRPLGGGLKKLAGQPLAETTRSVKFHEESLAGEIEDSVERFRHSKEPVSARSVRARGGFGSHERKRPRA